MSAEFADLYRSHYRRVLGLCLRLLGQRAQAEEATQEVFVKAYRAMDRYDPAQSFAAWVLRIASNHCIDLIRRRAREPLGFDEADTDVEAVAGGDADAEAALTGAEDAEAVRAAVDALPERYRSRTSKRPATTRSPSGWALPAITWACCCCGRGGHCDER